MKMLKARSWPELEQQKREQAQASYEAGKNQIAFGSQIRSYTLQPYQLVKDLRTEHETAAVQDVLDGDSRSVHRSVFAEERRQTSAKRAAGQQQLTRDLRRRS